MNERTTLSGKPPEEGRENAPAPAGIDPASGQHRDHYVLPAAERTKGFVRPVRRSYRHVGPLAPKNLRDLTDEERARYAGTGYVKFEDYEEARGCLVGRFWTQAQLAGLGHGCLIETTMPDQIAETYARAPGFYGETFCCGCRAYLPVEEFVWPDGSRVGS